MKSSRKGAVVILSTSNKSGDLHLGSSVAALFFPLTHANKLRGVFVDSNTITVTEHYCYYYYLVPTYSVLGPSRCLPIHARCLHPRGD